MIRRALPWWARVAAKMVLARLPVPCAAWRRLRLFRHGKMDRPEYALQVVSGHLERAGYRGRSAFAALEIEETLRLFEERGFAVEVTAVSRWDRLPTLRPALQLPYDSMPDEELRIKGFDVRLRHGPRSERR